MEDKLKLRNKALKLISYKEYSTKNLHDKLCLYIKKLSHDVCEDDVDEILEEFKEKRWISDLRAVECLINQKSSRFGSVRLRVELKKLNVSESIIKSALAKITMTEIERAELIIQKKYHDPPVNYNDNCKQKNYLYRKGFVIDVCNYVIDKRSIA